VLLGLILLLALDVIVFVVAGVRVIGTLSELAVAVRESDDSPPFKRFLFTPRSINYALRVLETDSDRVRRIKRSFRRAVITQAAAALGWLILGLTILNLTGPIRLVPDL
jgi:hypothetical protein